MIGKLVEHIVDAGFNVMVLTELEGFLLLRMAKTINNEIVSSDWALSHNELEVAYESVLMDQCEQRVQSFRQVIEEKSAGVKGRDQ